MRSDETKHDVFISYSTKNSELANKICYLLEQNKLKCWIAPRNIPSGTNYIEEITEGIKSTKIVVLVYSSYSQASKYVNNEINMAFSNNKPILSFNIDNSLPSEEMEYMKMQMYLSLLIFQISSLKTCQSKKKTEYPLYYYSLHYTGLRSYIWELSQA